MRKHVFIILLSTGIHCKMAGQSLADSIYMKKNWDKIFINPDPVKSGSYFKIKYPDNETLKQLELLTQEGSLITHPILLTKMGLYMPEVNKGEYYLKIYLSGDTLIKKVIIN